jgi:hypothetical protein
MNGSLRNKGTAAQALNESVPVHYLIQPKSCSEKFRCPTLRTSSKKIDTIFVRYRYSCLFLSGSCILRLLA